MMARTQTVAVAKAELAEAQAQERLRAEEHAICDRAKNAEIERLTTLVRVHDEANRCMTVELEQAEAHVRELEAKVHRQACEIQTYQEQNPAAATQGGYARERARAEAAEAREAKLQEALREALDQMLKDAYEHPSPGYSVERDPVILQARAALAASPEPKEA